MKTSILMVTYRKDLAFAEYAMQSTAKFATGFHECLLVVPFADVPLFAPTAFRHGFAVRGFNEREGKGFLHHAAIVCEADKWCPEADAILHQDADSLFTAPVTPADYITDGKPILVRERYEGFKQWLERYSWRQCVFDATGIWPEWETMCQHPLVHLPRTYQLTRELIAAHTFMDWTEYVLSCKNDFPQTFAEFPTLGAVGIQHHPNLYEMVDRLGGTLTPPQPPEKLFNFWSHGGLEHINDRHPGRRAIDVIREILA